MVSRTVDAVHMRVLFLLTDYPSATQPVPGMFHRTQAEALVRGGTEVEVVAPLPRVPPGFRFLAKHWREYSEVPMAYWLGPVHVRRPRYLHWPLRNQLGAEADRAFARAAAAAVTQTPHVIHAHFAYPPGLAALSLRKRWGVPSVLTLHGSDVNWFPRVNETCRRRFVDAVTGADEVIAVSEALAAATHRLTGRKPRVAPIGISTARHRAGHPKSVAREILSFPRAAKMVLYVGKLSKAKGVMELATAVSTLVAEGDDVLGIFVGSGPLRRAIRENRGCVSVGVEPNERIPLYMAAADVFVLPSHSEGMPTVLVEAGAAGLPVVASRVGGIPEFLGQDRGLLIDPGSSTEIHDAIRATLGDRNGAMLRAERLRRHVQENYDADANAVRLTHLYRAVCSTQVARLQARENRSDGAEGC